MPRRKPSTNFTREQALQGASVAGANARGLLEFAVAGAKSENYGPAIALCVLASEEGAKSLALLFEAVSPFPTGLSLSNVLSQHRTKHDIAQMMSAMAHLGRLLRKARDDVQSGIDSGTVNVKEAGSRWVANVVQQLKTTTENSAESDFITWYRNANALKEQGFYVDWMDGWRTPNSATRTDFELYRGYVEWWLDVVDQLLAVPPNEWESGFEKLRHMEAKGEVVIPR